MAGLRQNGDNVQIGPCFAQLSNRLFADGVRFDVELHGMRQAFDGRKSPVIEVIVLDRQFLQMGQRPQPIKLSAGQSAEAYVQRCQVR